MNKYYPYFINRVVQLSLMVLLDIDCEDVLIVVAPSLKVFHLN